MPTQSQIARVWKVSRAYVNELVLKRGMPIGTFKTIEEATRWRENNAMKRAAVRGRRAGVPRASSKSNDDSSPKDPDAQDDGSIESALRGTVEVASEAKWLVRSAMKAKDIASIPPLLSIHNKAVEARFDAERMYVEQMERRRALIPFSEATALFRKGFDAIVTRLKRIPQNKAPLCNPQAPLVAFGILDEAVNEILQEAGKIYSEYDVQPAA